MRALPIRMKHAPEGAGRPRETNDGQEEVEEVKETFLDKEPDSLHQAGLDLAGRSGCFRE